MRSEMRSVHCGAISRAVCNRERVMNCVMWLNLLSFAAYTRSLSENSDRSEGKTG